MLSGSSFFLNNAPTLPSSTGATTRTTSGTEVGPPPGVLGGVHFCSLPQCSFYPSVLGQTLAPLNYLGKKRPILTLQEPEQEEM